MARQYHPLVKSLLELRGNPRACIYVEPLWGIAFNLYAPFATLYMSHLGVSDAQIGLLLTVGMAIQIISSLLGSILIDKMGRRLSALVLGLLSWTIPPAILMLSQNFWWFFIAALFSGIALIESVAWNCLLVEDADPAKLVDMYNWATISGLLAVFFAPLAGLLVRSLSLVSAMRILYGFALIMMTAKTIILFLWSRETRHGLVRMPRNPGRSVHPADGAISRRVPENSAKPCHPTGSGHHRPDSRDQFDQQQFFCLVRNKKRRRSRMDRLLFSDGALDYYAHFHLRHAKPDIKISDQTSHDRRFDALYNSDRLSVAFTRNRQRHAAGVYPTWMLLLLPWFGRAAIFC